MKNASTNKIAWFLNASNVHPSFMNLPRTCSVIIEHSSSDVTYSTSYCEIIEEMLLVSRIRYVVVGLIFDVTTPMITDISV